MMTRMMGVQTCIEAARAGHLEVLVWARENGCDWDASTCSAAAENGHLAVLNWVRENGCDWYHMDPRLGRPRDSRQDGMYDQFEGQALGSLWRIREGGIIDVNLQL